MKREKKDFGVEIMQGWLALWIVLGIACTGSISAVIALAIIRNTSSSIDYDSQFCHPLVIAHRGASGYVPEHTLGAYALAASMGADYLEPDVVMLKDGTIIARHDNDLGLSTDVAEHPEFADRYRTQIVDGRQTSGWFTEDFTLPELKTLRAIERIPNVRPGNARMNYAMDVPTMQEIIDLAKGLEISLKKPIGIYPEIKHGTHFQKLGLAMEKPLVDMLHDNGYQGPEAPIYIQSFEVSNLKELATLTDLRLIQLFSARSLQPVDQAELNTTLTYGDMATAEGLMEIATYAYAVGPEKNYIIPRDADDRLDTPTSFVADAHAAGLKVHPYTFRAENPYLPLEFRSSNDIDGIGDFAGELRAFYEAGVDGVFADQPDIPHIIRNC